MQPPRRTLPAQTSYGTSSIGGQVVDSIGLVIPGAEAELLDVERGLHASQPHWEYTVGSGTFRPIKESIMPNLFWQNLKKSFGGYSRRELFRQGGLLAAAQALGGTIESVMATPLDLGSHLYSS